MWGGRVIIPTKLRQQLLEQLHEGHLGVVKMKTVARSYFWYPGSDSDIENLTKKCAGCSQAQNNPPLAPLHTWEWPSKPWQRIHVDFCGPVSGQMFLICVCAFSKWPEVVMMQSTTSERTIEALREIFSRNRLCIQLVSDNGPQFISDEFQKFMKTNGIKHIRSVPFHPATNGQAEKFVQTLKHGLKSMNYENGTVRDKLSRFLLAYRNAPHTLTNETLASLFMGRQLHTRLDVLKPDLDISVRNKQFQSMIQNGRPKLREFEYGQPVCVRDYRRNNNNKWTNGHIISRKGPLSYTVKTKEGEIWRRHVNQTRDRVAEDDSSSIRENVPDETLRTTPSTESVGGDADITPQATVGEENDSRKMPTSEIELADHRRYPDRVRNPPDRLNL